MSDLLRKRRIRPKTEPDGALVASASVVRPQRNRPTEIYDWQTEAWRFYRDFGTLRYAINWFSQSMSRVRLMAAIAEPGGDEPIPLTEGRPAELMRAFFGGSVGQSAYLRQMAVQKLVPGVGYVVAEQDETGMQHWSVKSTNDLRVRSARVFMDGRSQTVDIWEVQEGQQAWRALSPESYVIRQMTADAEYSWKPDSPLRGVLRDFRIIDMLERRIVATAVSRLAANGLLLYPMEVTFPAKPGYEDMPDPFTAEWLDIARKSIADPGSAEAAIPLPIKVPKDMIQYFTHIGLDSALDERLVEQLEQRYERVATGLNMPKEVLTGMGDTNHWSAWALDEQGVKVHIAPFAEEIAQDLTQAYLRPALLAEGADTYTAQGDIVAWFDTSELILPPDRSAAADEAFDRQMIGPEAYLREKGFGVGDRPKKAELREMLLLQLAKDPASAPTAIKELTGLELDMPEPAPTPEPNTTAPEAPATGTEPVNGPPQPQTGA